MLADCLIVLSVLVAGCQAGDLYCRRSPRARGCTGYPNLAAKLYREGEGTVSQFTTFVTKTTVRPFVLEAVVLPTAASTGDCPVQTSVPSCCITTATPCAITTVPIITPVAATAVATSTAVASVAPDAGTLEEDIDEYPDKEDVTSMTRKTMSDATANSFAASMFGAVFGLLIAVAL